jgi:hypothetical protein
LQRCALEEEWDGQLDRVQAAGVRSTAKLAVLNVGRARTAVRERAGVEIRILHHPQTGLRGDPSHCGIHGMPTPDADLGSAYWLMRSVSEIFPTR